MGDENTDLNTTKLLMSIMFNFSLKLMSFLVISFKFSFNTAVLDDSDDTISRSFL